VKINPKILNDSVTEGFMKIMRLKLSTSGVGLLIVVAVLLLALTMPACSKGGGGGGSGETVPTPEPEQKKVIIFDQELAKDVVFAAYAGASPAIETDDDLNPVPNYLSQMTTGFLRSFSKNIFKVELNENTNLQEILEKGGFPFIAFIAGIPGYNKSVEIKGINIGSESGTADLKIDYLGKYKDVNGTTWKDYTFTMKVHLAKAGYQTKSDGIDFILSGSGGDDITLVWNTSACLTLKLEGKPINTKNYTDNMNTIIKIMDFKCDNFLDFENCEFYNQAKWELKIKKLIGYFDFEFRFDSYSGEIKTSDALNISFKDSMGNQVNAKYNNWTITYPDCGIENEEKQFNFWEMPHLSPVSDAKHMTDFYKLDGVFSINEKSYRYDMVYGQVDDAVFSESMDKGNICAVGFKGKISVPRLGNLNQMVDVESKYADDFEKIFLGTPIVDYYFDKFSRSIDMHFDNIIVSRSGSGFNEGSLKLSYKKPAESEAAKASVMFNSNQTLRIDANPAVANWKKVLSPVK